ncbi:MAG: ribulose-phosphate 3-epimerase [Alphaproteobacteria bacterium]|nr:ribulose-phosphate 3-epimerase [Alphaproteobacteria bacterium]
MQLYPSLLAVWDAIGGEPAALVAAAVAAQAGGADALHLDFMAPPFTSRTTFGADLVPRLRHAGVTLPLDCHLMTGPAWVPAVLAERPASLVFHPKMAGDSKNMAEILATVAAAGVRAGVALDHDEPVAAVADLLRHPACGQVTLLTVTAGAGGQALRPELLAKVAEIHAIHPVLPVVVDGGVNAATIAAVAGTGAHAAVAGSAVFGAGMPADNIKRLKNIKCTKNISEKFCP